MTALKARLGELVSDALTRLPDDLLPPGIARPPAIIERTRDARHGDFACNIALTLAKPARRKPRELAAAIVTALEENSDLASVVARTEIAGPGFINFHLAPAALHEEIGRILDSPDTYGHSTTGAGERVLVEFVSANPTGPLHVGHGRLAAYGATVANLLEAIGHDVGREYYVNDAGRQMAILAISTWVRYLQARGEDLRFPENGYRGDYIRRIAAAVADAHGDALRRPAADVTEGLPADAPDGDKEIHIDALIARGRELLGEDGYRQVLDAALHDILADIRDDLAGFGVTIDTWFSEGSLVTDKLIEHALDKLREHEQVYEKDGALWFRASAFGDDKDRVVVRDNGQTTYIASDIAYHLNKRERGYDRLLDILGSDHHGYVARVRAGLSAMGEPPESLEVRLVQFAVLYRDGRKLPMSTRSGEFVTLRQLREDVGDDAARFFYVMRSNEQHLDFDLDLARSRSNENPVYYVQYAHARVCSVLRQLAERNLEWDAGAGRAALPRLDSEHEVALMVALGRYPEVIESAAVGRAPQQLVQYLRDLANHFHTYYNAHKFIVDDVALRDARIALIVAVRAVVRSGLTLLGVSSPEAM